MADSGTVSAPNGRVLVVSDVVVDLDAFEIRREGERVPVEPQVFDVIEYLITRPGRVVSKEELLDNVWGTRFVSEASLTSRIKMARRVLGDDGTRQGVIATVHGRGYRFVAPVEPASDRPPVGHRDGDAAMHRSIGVQLPTPLTAFVGRERELGELLEAMASHRLVTATGPGGVGKTRLALAAASRASSRQRDGVGFVDLVAVSEPAMVVDAVAAAVGVVERAQTDRRAALLTALADRACLLVVDNCEHLIDAVRSVVEDVLTLCPDVRVLATSRIRLMLPYERVYPVPGLAVSDDDGELSGARDAVELFTVRMADAGERPGDDPATLSTIAGICRSLDGVALAIEIAAARAPSIGLHGLREALASQLTVLSRGGDGGDRHASLRATIDWTYRLLDDDDRATLLAAATFATQHDAAAVAAVMDRPIAEVLVALGHLVDWNLAARQHESGRFRLLESIRQFAFDQAEHTGEAARVRDAHLAWVGRRLDALATRAPGDEAWCDDVDAVLPDGRAALRWAADDALGRDASGFAALLARVTFDRGRPAEAQARYEEAAEWAESVSDRHRWLRSAAGAASARNVGADALVLLERAAQVALEAGRPDDAAIDLANAAIYRNRASGIIGHPVSTRGTDDLIRRARELLTGQEPVAEATVALAESWIPEASFRDRESAERALTFARSVGDPVLENIALDLWTVVALDTDDLDEAIAAIRSRISLLDTDVVDPVAGFEVFDAHQMACRLEIARGDFHSARTHADALARLPFLREERHLGLGRRMEVDALAGEFAQAIAASELFRRDWELAGRPKASNLSPGCYAIGMVYGLLGDDDRRSSWIETTMSLFNPSKHQLVHEAGWAPVMDALVDLERDEPDRALARLGDDPDDLARWSNPNRRVWRLWYEAAWAEAAVLGGRRDVDRRIERAASVTHRSRFAAAIVERARCVRRGDADGVSSTAAEFEALGAVYQAARSHRLAGLAGRPG